MISYNPTVLQFFLAGQHFLVVKSMLRNNIAKLL